MSSAAFQLLLDIGSRHGVPIYRPGSTQLHFLIRDADGLRQACAGLREMGCYLVTLVANDERELEDHCFKLYYHFSHPEENIFITLEFLIHEGQETYATVADLYPAAEPFEYEIADLFGLFPERQTPRPLLHTHLHSSYPEGLHPLRRSWSQETYVQFLKSSPSVLSMPLQLQAGAATPDGELFLPVGPIHAGVIEPGNFLFRIGGESIEELDISLGYTHKGIERMYQSSFNLLDGYQLAEKVSGDSSFAHTLAYCKACENLARVNLGDEIKLLRAILLELERIANHINDCAALVHDLALDIPAADVGFLREQVMRLCAQITHSRFLRNVNCPGGMRLPQPFDPLATRSRIQKIVQEFMRVANMLIQRSDFRERTLNTGVLLPERALRLGVTGLVARASGVERDFRLQHPFGPYKDAYVQNLIRDAIQNVDLYIPKPFTMSGDVYSRFLQRVIEVDAAGRLIQHFCQQWRETPRTEFVEPILLDHVPNYETGIGYVEGWRGDIIYWLMKDKFDGIFRCKVRDPSLLNWAGLREAVAGKKEIGGSRQETALVDFPLINKSFNLSYSGVDL